MDVIQRVRSLTIMDVHEKYLFIQTFVQKLKYFSFHVLAIYVRAFLSLLELARFSSDNSNIKMAVPWIRRLVSSRRTGFDPGSVHVRYVFDNLALGRYASTSVFPCQFHSTFVPLHGKTEKTNHFYLFITGLHNKPQGCGASVASAAGPFTTKNT
jgi:hypothetical protein